MTPWAPTTLHWTRIDYLDGKTLPPYGAHVLAVDMMGTMAVVYLDRSHDFMLALDQWAQGDVNWGNGFETDDQDIYFRYPIARMPLPPTPLPIIEGDADYILAMRTNDLLAAIEPAIRSVLIEALK